MYHTDSEENWGMHDRKQMDHLIIFQLQVTHWVQKSASHPSVQLFLIINKYAISLGQHVIKNKNKNSPRTTYMPWMEPQEGRVLAQPGWACVGGGCRHQEVGAAEDG